MNSSGFKNTVLVVLAQIVWYFCLKGRQIRRREKILNFRWKGVSILHNTNPKDPNFVGGLSLLTNSRSE